MKVERIQLNGVYINRTDSELSWRLVHDGNKVIKLFQSKGITSCIYEIFVAKTLEECQTEIYCLNLEYNTEK